MKRDWFRFVTNKAATTTPGADAEIFVFGDIGETYWSEGVSAQSFVDQLAALEDTAELAIRINSYGGSAWDGMAIANAIMRFDGHTTCYIDGVAASAASIVAFAGDDVVASKYSRGMLHNASAMVMGTADDMREVATQIEALNATMAAYYADRSADPKLDAAAFAAIMAAETWYSADEMLAVGLITSIDTSTVREEVEKAAASALAKTSEPYAAQGIPALPTTKESKPMAFKDDLAKRLGKDPADLTDEDLYKAALDALGDPEPASGGPAAPASTDTPATGAPEAPAGAPGGAPAPAAAPTPVPAAASAGTVTVDSAAFEDLKRQAAMGAKAFEDAQAKSDQAVVDKAIEEGRIPLARAGHYLALMSADRTDTIDLLTNRLAKDAAVPMHEMGHSADLAPVATVTENDRYKTFTKGLGI